MTKHRFFGSLLVAAAMIVSPVIRADGAPQAAGHFTPADRTPRLRSKDSTQVEKDQLAHLLCMRAPRFTDKEMQKKCLGHIQAPGYFTRHGLYRIASDICVNFNSTESKPLPRAIRGTACFQTALRFIGGPKKNLGDFMKVYDPYCLYVGRRTKDVTVNFVSEYACYTAAFAAVSKPDPDGYFKRHAP